MARSGSARPTRRRARASRRTWSASRGMSWMPGRTAPATSSTIRSVNPAQSAVRARTCPPVGRTEARANVPSGAGSAFPPVFLARGRSVRFGLGLKRALVSRCKRLDECRRHPVGRHLGEVAIELDEQLPVLRLGAALGLAAAAEGALEARFELGRVESADELDERRAQRLRARTL